MTKYLYALFLPALLLISCGDDTNVVKEDSNKVVYDSFKEGVLKLQRNGFLDAFKGQSIDSLTEVYRKDSSNGMKQMLIDAGSLLHLKFDFDPNDSASVASFDAPKCYRAISDTIAAHYPDLAASDWKHEYLPNFPGDKDTGWILYSQKFGDQWYTRKFYYWKDWPVDNFIYRMYNTLLADRGEDTRFYLIDFFRNEPDTGFHDDFMLNLDVTQMGLMRLTKQQADTILSIPELDIEPESEFEIFTSKQTEDMIEKFKTTGLVTAELEKWYNDTISNDIRWNSLYKQEDFLDFVDHFFAQGLMFDTLNVFDPYADILGRMEMGSRGDFKPNGMSDEAIGQSNVRTVRFTLSGTVYEKDLASQNGIISPLIFDMVNDALADQGIGGAFYSVMTRGDVVLALYLRDEEVDKVMQSGFFEHIEKGAPTELMIIYGQEPKAF